MDSKSTIYMSSIIDSINTSITMKLFKNREEAAFSHIFNSKLVKIPLNTFKNDNVDNFYSVKLQKSAVKAYPLTDRPRGKEDIISVKYYQKQIQQKKRNYTNLDDTKKQKIYIIRWST
jgi:hypothetical protein